MKPDLLQISDLSREALTRILDLSEEANPPRVLEGQGVALGRRHLLSADLNAGRLVRPFDLGLPIPFSHWFVYPPEALNRPKVRAFRDWIVAEAEAERGDDAMVLAS